MNEVIIDSYLKWPASADDRIRVKCWIGNEPVQTHKHDFIEIAFLAIGKCMHRYHGSGINLIPGDIIVITPHEEHSYEISADTTIYNCLFFPDALGEDWQRLKKDNSIYDLLIVESFYRPESGIHEILHLSPTGADAVTNVLNEMLTEQGKRVEGFELMQKANLLRFLCMLGREWGKQFIDNNNVY